MSILHTVPNRIKLTFKAAKNSNRLTWVHLVKRGTMQPILDKRNKAQP